MAVKCPDLVAQWHPTLNGDLTPEQIPYNTTTEVWWILPHDDAESGKHFDFVWYSEVRSRYKGSGCPYLSNKAVWPGYNDLFTKRPDLAAQWDYEKNGGLTPRDVVYVSTKSFSWIYPYDDPETGRHFDFRWNESVSVRAEWSGCPFLSGRRVWTGFNDLATKRPDLAAQWHPTKNKGATPDTVACNCNDKVWWILPFDDPETGLHHDFEWEDQICERNRGSGCPVLSGHQVHSGFNDLATKRPDLAAQWHPTKNRDLTPQMVTCGCETEVIWLLPYDDPETGRHFDFDWPATVVNRVNGTGCPYLTGRAVWPGYNDLATKRPDLAAQWHPTKNGDLTPEMLTSGSGERIWWIYPYDDPESGKHFDFEWPAIVAGRTDDSCPFITGRAVWPGYNDLATKRPDLAAQWHPTKNGDLTPQMVTSGSTERVYWILPYDDPITGRHFDFDWPATVCSRNAGSGCPYLSGHEVYPGFNDLATRNPDLAAQWHPTKNGDLTPEMVTCGSTERVYWLFPYDDPITGRHFDFDWPADVNSRNAGSGCPYLSGHAVWPGYNDLESCYPDIAAEWHPTRNRRLTPAQVYKARTNKAWWKCSRCGHEWYASVKGRTLDGAGCSVCRKNMTYL